MRYKGENKIHFSCDPEKNVTIVLGDNTVGKTTIAQAFRWGLYGELLVEKGKNSADYMILNKDIVNLMDADTRATASVEIRILTDEKRYTIKREIVYRRKYPSYLVEELFKRKKLEVSNKTESGESGVEVEDNQIDNVVKELFPKDLSQYFLFDGERWNDIGSGGVKEDIKESVHKITGLYAIQQSMYHLKDIGRTSVISKMRGKISGGGAIFDSLQADIDKDEYQIDKLEEENQTLQQNIAMEQSRANEIDEFLLNNKSTEVMQSTYKETEQMVRYMQNNLGVPYKMLVNEWSEKGLGYFAEPMIQRCLKILGAANLERKDIPHMHQSTIDYLIDRGACICGCKIVEGSKEHQCLLEQRNYLPPADIGSILGEFERTSNRWLKNNDEFVENMQESAQKVKNEYVAYDEKYNEYMRLGEKLDQNYDFAQKRSELKQRYNRINQLSQEEGKNNGKIESLKNHINRLTNELSTMEAKNNENAKWKERVSVATEIYNRMRDSFEKREKQTFLELNSRIQENFGRMFNAKDKKIELDKFYNINMLYATDKGYAIERNLSEGEKVARNFAFITTIMEYAKEKHDEGDKNVDTLPIVLDGPFSKLGEENIQLVAKALPEIADQVIIFMLKKDWAYTKLDEYVGASYYIEKANDQAFASIKEMEVC